MSTVVFKNLPVLSGVYEDKSKNIGSNLLPMRLDLKGQPSADGIGKGKELVESQIILQRDVVDGDLIFYRVALLSTRERGLWQLTGQNAVCAEIRYGANEGFKVTVNGFLVDSWSIRANDKGGTVTIIETLVIRVEQFDSKVELASHTSGDLNFKSALA